MGIPENVLFGRIPRFIAVRNLYRKVLYETLMEKFQKSYFDRAFWGTDDYGESWHALKVSTELIKNGEATEDPRSNPQVTGAFTNKRQLSPAQLKEYKKKYREVLNSGKKASTANRRSLKNITLVKGEAQSFVEEQLDFDTGEGEEVEVNYIKTPINIRTARLVGALSPAEIANNRIYAGPDQTFELSEDGLSISFSLAKVPYAEKMEGPYHWDKEEGTFYREVFTEAHMKVIEESHDAAIKEAKVLYLSLLKNPDKVMPDDNRRVDKTLRRSD